MKAAIERTHRLLNMPLEAGPRFLLLAATLSLVATYFLPLWKVAPAARKGFGTELITTNSNRGCERTSTHPLMSPGRGSFQWTSPNSGGFRSPLAFSVFFSCALRYSVRRQRSSTFPSCSHTSRCSCSGLWAHGSRGTVSPIRDPGAYVLAGVGFVLGAALFLAWRQGLSEIADDVRMAG